MASRGELTAHQQARARFANACLTAGKLRYAAPQIWREMKALARRSSLANGRARSARRPGTTGPRVRSGASSRGSPSSDDPSPSPDLIRSPQTATELRRRVVRQLSASNGKGHA
jgi:hypothetical protein